jgi:acetyl-CoA carboxylase biotin carboxyl carrier protein
MDLKQIHDLIKVVNKSNIGEISIEDKDGKVTIKQKEDKITVNSAPAQMYTAAPASAPVAAPVATNTPLAPVADNLITIKSPMIGTFYRRAAPDKPLMAEEGTEVSPGKVVCIIEAMKLFNEIESEIKGTIVKVLVEDASPVEYDQPLFLVQPA